MKWVLIVILLIPIIFLGWCHYIENPKSTYKNYNDVLANHAINAGWIPEFLPKSATNIIEQHNIDTNITHITFLADQEEIKELKKICDITVIQSVKWTYKYPLWWPKNLKGINKGNEKRVYYHCKDDDSFITVLDNTTVYYWSF